MQISDEEFRKAWQEALAETRGTEDDGYLDFYIWELVEEKGNRCYYLEMEDGAYSSDSGQSFLLIPDTCSRRNRTL